MDLFWWELGRRASLIQQGRLWELLGYKSFTAYINAACVRSRATVYAAMRTWKALGKLSEEDKKTLPIRNAQLLAKQPESKRFSAEYLLSAQTLTSSEFRSYVDQRRTILEAGERFVRKVFSFTESQWQMINEVMLTARAQDGLKPEQVIEFAVVEFQQEHYTLEQSQINTEIGDDSDQGQ